MRTARGCRRAVRQPPRERDVMPFWETCHPEEIVGLPGETALNLRDRLSTPSKGPGQTPAEPPVTTLMGAKRLPPVPARCGHNDTTRAVAVGGRWHAPRHDGSEPVRAGACPPHL